MDRTIGSRIGQRKKTSCGPDKLAPQSTCQGELKLTVLVRASLKDEVEQDTGCLEMGSLQGR